MRSGARSVPRYSVAVRSLCEFTARSGDLSVRFTPAPSAEQGIAGHRRVGGRRGPGYIRELALQGTYQTLIVRGRADGYDPQRNLLEEYKTHRGDPARVPDNQRALHWAQLKIYGAMLCVERGLGQIDLSLVYFDIQSERETCLTEHCSAQQLTRYFEDHCERFLVWATLEMAHRERRERFLSELRFPHESLRSGQRQVAEAVYRSALAGQTVMVQAPTGIGKTLGTLFPQLKAAPRRRLDKIFFLVAKTSGRDLALGAVRQLLGDGPAALRTIELVAKDAACSYPGRACEADSCPLAKGFYDRLAAARAAALDSMLLDRDLVRSVALAHQVCPYYLTQELARWCDVVVGDYHYFFDTHAMLHALTQQNQWRVGLLVDEAHNLLGRARGMYSASLESAALDAALQAAPAPLEKPLRDVQRAWHSIHSAQVEDYAAYAEVPAQFVMLLQRVTAAIADDAALGASPPDDALLRFFFDTLHFCRMAEAFGAHSLFDVTQQTDGSTARGSTLCIRCVNPGAFLSARFGAVVTATVFSATLAPADFYRQLLGLPDATRWVNVASPFDERQLEVRIAPRISTRYHDRPRSYGPIVNVIADQYRADPGNYLAFFSSFDYLQAVLQLFKRRFPGIPACEQTRDMAAPDRAAFLARFAPGSRGVGFAVLGGAFAEGIDLPGDRLIGVFIATLGLPQVNDINTEMQRRMQTLFGCGYEYTYLYPGLQKVVQAAGRVIRSPTDRGTVVLIDDRYSAARVRRLLPEWWRMASPTRL